MSLLKPDMGKLVWAVGGLLIGPKVVQWVRGLSG